ncbi:Putative carboxymethylenebutenolidase [Leucoagaricus sp. SymC.cos]|nr:Putative carboxymethylenebutenolidase [Leucoagaricus sp. SymC.cos]
MLITRTHHDVPSKLDNGRPIRIYVISPSIPNYPQAKFPGVVVFSEIYQVTGPVERFAGQIASQGFVVACPSVYHEFEGPEPIPYDTEAFRVGKDATLSIDLLVSLENCNGRIATTGMCLGGHLAAFDSRVLSSVCFFATDIHRRARGKCICDPTLVRFSQYVIQMIFGKQDTHVPREGRDLIRKTLEDANVTCSFLEVQAQHAFIRDEHSKGRWDAALARSLFGFMMEVFERTAGRDLGPRRGENAAPEHVC